MWLGDKKEMIMAIRPPGKMHCVLVCFGAKRHYRKDGSCKHTEAVLAMAKSPWHRARIHLEPFGGKAQ